MIAENTAVVAVPNEFTRAQLEGRLRTRIEDTLTERLGKPVRLVVSVDPALEEDAGPTERAAAIRSAAGGARLCLHCRASSTTGHSHRQSA